jgi:hypothetical protein
MDVKRGRLTSGLRIAKRLGAGLVVAAIVLLPAVIKGASSGHGKPAKHEFRTTAYSGADAIAYMARQHARNPLAKQKWEAGVRKIEARGHHLGGHLKAVHLTKITVYEPTATQVAMHFVSNLFDATARANAPNCDDYPDLCDVFDGGDAYYDDYDWGYDYGTGVFTEEVAYTDYGSEVGTLDGDIFTDPNDPWNFDTLDYELNDVDFDPEASKPPTFHGVPCTSKADVGMKMFQLIFEKAMIAAIAGGIAGSFATPAGTLVGALSAFNVTGFSATLYYYGEYFWNCVMGWGSSEPMPVELTAALSLGRP